MATLRATVTRSRDLGNVPLYWGAPEGVLFLTLLFGTVAFSRDFAYLSVTLGGLSIYATDTWLAALGVLVVRRLAAAGTWRELRSPLDPWMGCWLAIGLVEVIRGLGVDTIRSLRDFAIVYYAAFFYLARLILTTPDRVRWAMGAFLAGTVVRIGATTLEYVFAVDLLAGLRVAPVAFAEHYRSIGRFLAGYDGLYIVVASLVVAALWRTRPRKLLLFGYLCAGGFSLLLAQQRSLLLAVLFGWGALWGLSRWASLPRPAPLVAWCLGSLALGVGLTVAAIELRQFDLASKMGSKTVVTAPWMTLPSELQKKVATPVAYGTTQFRLQAWREAWHRFTRNPFLGEGFGRPFVFYDDSARRWFTEDVRPHNTYLTVLYKMGIVGGTVFVGLHLTFLQWVVRLWQGAATLGVRVHAAGYAAALLALQAYGGLNLLLESPYTAVVYWSLAGLLVASLERALAPAWTPGALSSQRADESPSSGA